MTGKRYAMKVPLEQLFMMTATLAGILAATDPRLDQAAASPSLAITGAVALRLRAQPLPAPTADSTPWAADIRRVFSEKRPAPDCSKPCDATNKGPLIAEQLLTELGSDPLLGTVMAPVTRGVPISTGDGTPALKLAVIPTQITRGSGLVAIGHF